MFLEHNPTSRNDLHLFSLCRHVLSCALVCVCLCVTSVRSAVSAASVSLCVHEVRNSRLESAFVHVGTCVVSLSLVQRGGVGGGRGG